MVNHLSEVSKFLSTNINSLRRSRGLSQSGLAKLASVPRSTVTYLESGTGNPSLQNLIRVAGALQVSIEELLRKPRGNCQLIKKDSIQGQKRANGMVVIFKLLPDPIPAMELDRVKIQPGARMGGVPHTPQTKEYMVCISGQIEVAVSGTKYQVDPGDVLAFSGDQPHSYSNRSEHEAEFVSVVVLAPHGV
jgi:transcriptional regulator with XRE-family HTH domain